MRFIYFVGIVCHLFAVAHIHTRTELLSLLPSRSFFTSIKRFISLIMNDFHKNHVIDDVSRFSNGFSIYRLTNWFYSIFFSHSTLANDELMVTNEINWFFFDIFFIRFFLVDHEMNAEQIWTIIISGIKIGRSRKMVMVNDPWNNSRQMAVNIWMRRNMDYRVEMRFSKTKL